MGCNFGSEKAFDNAYLPTEANMGLKKRIFRNLGAKD